MLSLPRPNVDFDEIDEKVLSFSLEPPNVIDISALFNHVFSDGGGASKLQRLWLVLLMKNGVGPARCKLLVVDIFRVLVHHQAADVATAQICLRLSTQLELVLAGANKAGSSLCGGLGFLFRSSMPGPEHLYMEETLFQYVQQGRCESLRHRVVSIATDKASPAFLPLQNSLLSYPSGIAVVCCPQAMCLFH